MNYDFKEEIAVFERSENVEDKLMAFSLYYDIYQALIRRIEKQDRQVAYHYGECLSKTLQSIATGTIFGDVPMDAAHFAISFYEVLSISSFIDELNNVIEYHRENLGEFIKAMQYVPVIDTLNIDFPQKAQLLMVFRKHINQVYCIFTSLYGVEESYTLRHVILEELTKEIPEMCENGIATFQNSLLEATNKIIRQKIADERFDAYAFQDTTLKNFGESLNRLLAGYWDTEMSLPEVLAATGLSKIRYYRSAFTLGLKVLKYDVCGAKTIAESTFQKADDSLKSELAKKKERPFN